MFSFPECFNRSYPAVAASVPMARSELTAFAQRSGVGGRELEMIRLAASEAVTNAVLHAYESASGDPAEQRIQVCASVVGDGISVLVADDGQGMRTRTTPSAGLGLGLVLMSELADEFQVVSRGGGGTELRMRFDLPAVEQGSDAQARGSVSSAAAPA